MFYSFQVMFQMREWKILKALSILTCFFTMVLYLESSLAHSGVPAFLRQTT